MAPTVGRSFHLVSKLRICPENIPFHAHSRFPAISCYPAVISCYQLLSAVIQLTGVPRIIAAGDLASTSVTGQLMTVELYVTSKKILWAFLPQQRDIIFSGTKSFFFSLELHNAVYSISKERLDEMTEILLSTCHNACSTVHHDPYAGVCTDHCLSSRTIGATLPCKFICGTTLPQLSMRHFVRDIIGKIWRAVFL